MGGRGAASGASYPKGGKMLNYGDEFRTVFAIDNIKFVVNKLPGRTQAPMETQTPNRVYVTLNKDTMKPQYIDFNDENGKRYKQIDIDGKPHYVMQNGKKVSLGKTHVHFGYEHNENGDSALSQADKNYVKKIKKLWRENVKNKLLS